MYISIFIIILTASLSAFANNVCDIDFAGHPVFKPSNVEQLKNMEISRKGKNKKSSRVVDIWFVDGTRGVFIAFGNKGANKELLAYQIDRLFKIYMVPESFERRVGDESGVIVLWGEGVDYGAASRRIRKLSNERLKRLKFLDYLIGNFDRHYGLVHNFKINEKMEVIAFDHEGAFVHHDDYFQNAMDWEGFRRLEKEVISYLNSKDGKFYAEKIKSLNIKEIESLAKGKRLSRYAIDDFISRIEFLKKGLREE